MADARSKQTDAPVDLEIVPDEKAARGLALYTIPAHRAFADALAAGLIRRFGGDPLSLARGLVLLPNNRAVRTVTDAFVRASGGGLLLPRLVPIGAVELGEGLAAALDPVGEAPVAPAIAPLERRMILARLVSEARARAGEAVDGAEAVRLAGELAETLDQLLVEEVAPTKLRAIEPGGALQAHWEQALALFDIVLDAWPKALAERGRIELAERRARLLDALGRRWRAAPPDGFVCAAGITSAAPGIARLLRVVAGLPRGLVVLPDLAITMDETEWRALTPEPPRRPIETHPQFQLKLLLDRMGVAREEFSVWREGGGHDAPAARGRAVAEALAPAEFTHRWTTLPAEARRLSGVRVAELANPAEEAQAIALALREALEVPGKTAALVTPDRALARRVAALLGRWGVAIDDSAGRPLSILPPGTLLIALAEAAVQRFAPLALLALLKHPLVRAGATRLDWLEGVRGLDLVLRGPRPAPGLDGITTALAAAGDTEAADWWREAVALLTPLEASFAAGPQPLDLLVAAVREGAQALCGDALWAGPAGRAAADLLADLEAQARLGPPRTDPRALPELLRLLAAECAVRPPQGGHPRLAIYGLIEARLQTADLMVLGGLNESVWPGQSAPDPWLAPRIRAELGLPGLDRRVGLAAHDLASALGAPEVLLTRAKRDAKGPAIASRFWLRLQALTGGLPRRRDLEHFAQAIDTPAGFDPAKRPEPCPPAALRPKRISVTEVDRLKADPFAFYAKRVLGLAPLDAVDADPSAAWRGTAVHAILEAWARDDACAPGKLRARAETLMRAPGTHPLLRALWQPRLIEAIDWIARETQQLVEQGRRVIAVEQSGMIDLAGVQLRGKADRIDRTADGGLVVIDYKTGKAPSAKAVRAGFSLQLGLLGLIAERGGFEGVNGTASDFEYWSLAKQGDQFGHITRPVHAEGARDLIRTDEFTTIVAAQFTVAAADWLTGDAPFTAKLHPDYAPYGDYDQLMRLEEWYGR
ncbi:MAG: double-strand break repair protein AddB [Sphingomonas sp.]|uniref:double-strand break repair protein AddB n=1 Tax=Sphingomonas sp. TaxID=28214 RepID=UPI0025F8EB17|nr:double-strand break repair protein AddB [Sphingomonas sp.]MBX9882788.1 double-strand break repair protein AddB [Sphingomonas sp.]